MFLIKIAFKISFLQRNERKNINLGSNPGLGWMATMATKYTAAGVITLKWNGYIDVERF